MSCIPQDKELGLLDLPLEILREIILSLSEGYIDLNANTTRFGSHLKYPYISNDFIISEAYLSLLYFSSTCQSLRVLLGNFLFAKVSLVRCNEIDTLMTYPKSLELFSDEKKFHRLIMREILGQGCQECSRSQLAKESFRNRVLGDTSFKSTYETLLGFHNYTTHLECGNHSIRFNDLSIFRNISSLKILDTAASDAICIPIIQKLQDLSINIATLMNFDTSSLSIIKQLLRLNVLFDFSEIDPSKFASFRKAFENSLNLEELNIFFSSSNTLKYSETLDFLQSIFENSENLRSVNLRLLKSGGWQELQYNDWSLYSNKEMPLFIKIIKGIFSLTKLEQAGMDIQILEDLTCPMSAIEEFDFSERHKKSLCITLIDKSFSSPRFKPALLKKLRFMIIYGQASAISLQYGEVIEQCHIQALNSMTSLMEFLSVTFDSKKVYHGIKNISLEKCWSVSDDTILREYYQNIVNEIQETNNNSKRAELNHKLKRASPIDRLPINSPRYRRRETFSVTYKGQLSSQYIHPDSEQINTIFSLLPQTVTFPSYENFNGSISYYSSSEYFWKVELLLLELEYYCVTKRKPSSIWD